MEINNSSISDVDPIIKPTIKDDIVELEPAIIIECDPIIETQSKDDVIEVEPAIAIAMGDSLIETPGKEDVIEVEPDIAIAMGDPLIETPDKEDVIEVEPDVPKRKPIGWNYQNVFIASKKERELNGTCHNVDNVVKSQNSSSDDIEVLEILETVDKPSKKVKPSIKKNVIPRTNLKNNKSRISSGDKLSKLNNIHSSTKKEIKDILRGVRQASITKFFQPNLPKERNSTSLNVEEEGIPSKSYEKKPLDEEQPNASLTNEGLNEEKSIANGEEDKEETPVNPNSSGQSEINLSEHSKSVMEKFIEKWKSVKAFEKYDEQVKGRLWKHYHACDNSYIHSRKFITGLKTGTIQLSKDNLVVFLSSIIKNLKKYKDIPYIEKEEDPDEWLRKKTLECEGGSSNDGNVNKEEEKEELTEEELKKRRKTKKIERAMTKISKRIQKLETEEVDLDDEDNSSYLIIERLKSQFVKLDELYCKTANYSTATGRPVEKKFRYEGSRYPEINKRIMAWVNKNRCFPEYMDVLNMVKKVTKDTALPLRPEVVRVQAQEIFRDVGRILKSRREKDDYFCIKAYASLEGDLSIDPADDDLDLRRRLKENEVTGNKNLDNVFQHFVNEEVRKKDEERIAEKSTSKEETEKEENEEKEASKGEEGEGNDKGEEADNEEAGSLNENEDEEEADNEDDNETDIEQIEGSDDENGGVCDDDGEEDDDEEEEEEDEDEDEEDEDEDDDKDDVDKIKFMENNVESQVENSPSDVSDGEEMKMEESDDDIQEILNAPVLKLDDLEEEEEEQEESFEDNYKIEPPGRHIEAFSDEDIEIATSPPPFTGQVNGCGFPDTDLKTTIKIDQSPVSEFTHFKRKKPLLDLREKTSYFSTKKRRISSSEPEIVELD